MLFLGNTFTYWKKNASTGKLGVIASEEEDHPVLVEEAFNSRYVAVFDPLDGSSNIDAAISTGTIFGIFEETEVCVLLFLNHNASRNDPVRREGLRCSCRQTY